MRRPCRAAYQSAHLGLRLETVSLLSEAVTVTNEQGLQGSLFLQMAQRARSSTFAGFHPQLTSKLTALWKVHGLLSEEPCSL